MDNLPLLRDIHLPTAQWRFPLGYGWLWLIAALVVAYALYRFWQTAKLKSRKNYALRLIEECSENSICAARGISEILRRICLYKYRSAASLYNREWIEFLNQHSKQKISGDTAKLLIGAPYMPEQATFDPHTYQDLRRFAKHWIGENL